MRRSSTLVTLPVDAERVQAGRDRRRGGRSESRQIRECRCPRTSGTLASLRNGRPRCRFPLDAVVTPTVSLMPRLRPSPRTGLPVVMEQERTVSRVVAGRSSRGRERERDALELWPCQSCGLPAAVAALALRLGPRAAPAPRRGSRSPAPAGSAGASWRSAPARAPRGRPWSPRAPAPTRRGRFAASDDVDGSADGDFAVQVDDVGDRHPDAAVRGGVADRAVLAGVDSVDAGAAVEGHEACL